MSENFVQLPGHGSDNAAEKISEICVQLAEGQRSDEAAEKISQICVQLAEGHCSNDGAENRRSVLRQSSRKKL